MSKSRKGVGPYAGTNAGTKADPALTKPSDVDSTGTFSPGWGKNRQFSVPENDEAGSAALPKGASFGGGGMTRQITRPGAKRYGV